MKNDPDVREFRKQSRFTGIATLGVSVVLVIVSAQSDKSQERRFGLAFGGVTAAIGVLTFFVRQGVAIDRRGLRINQWRFILGYRENREVQLSSFRKICLNETYRRGRSRYNVQFEGPEEDLIIANFGSHASALRRLEEIAAFLGTGVKDSVIELSGFRDPVGRRQAASDATAEEEEKDVEGSVRFERDGELLQIRLGLTRINAVHCIVSLAVVGCAAAALLKWIIPGLRSHASEWFPVQERIALGVAVGGIVLLIIAAPIHLLIRFWVAALLGWERIRIVPGLIQVVEPGILRWKTRTHRVGDLISIRRAPSRDSSNGQRDVLHLEFRDAYHEVGFHCTPAEIHRVHGVLRQRLPDAR